MPILLLKLSYLPNDSLYLSRT